MPKKKPAHDIKGEFWEGIISFQEEHGPCLGGLTLSFLMNDWTIHHEGMYVRLIIANVPEEERMTIHPANGEWVKDPRGNTCQ